MFFAVSGKMYTFVKVSREVPHCPHSSSGITLVRPSLTAILVNFSKSLLFSLGRFLSLRRTTSWPFSRFSPPQAPPHNNCLKSTAQTQTPVRPTSDTAPPLAYNPYSRLPHTHTPPLKEIAHKRPLELPLSCTTTPPPTHSSLPPIPFHNICLSDTEPLHSPYRQPPDTTLPLPADSLAPPCPPHNTPLA